MPDPTYVELAIIEMQAQLDSLPAKIEGLNDYRSLNLHQDTKESVISTIDFYQERKALLEASIGQCNKLLADGYPALPVQEVPPDQFQDLQDNLESLQTAVVLFTTEKAADLGITVGKPEPKA